MEQEVVISCCLSVWHLLLSWLTGFSVSAFEARHHEHCGGKEEGGHICVSNVIKLLKLFSVMSELSKVLWGKMHRIWSLEGPRNQMWQSCRGRVVRRCASSSWEG